MVRYVLVAALLGAGWFPLMLLPPLSRGWLLEAPFQNLVLLMSSSVIVAIALRRFIAGATGMRAHVWRGVVVPYLGCVVYLTAAAIVLWIRDPRTSGALNVHDMLSLYWLGFVAALMAFPIVVLYGIACQMVLHAVLPRT
jgi:hypothetical protein